MFDWKSWRELDRKSWRMLKLCWMIIMLSDYLMHLKHRWKDFQNLSVFIYVQFYQRFSALSAMLSSINNVAENSLLNWSTSFLHALIEKDSDVHSLDQYYYQHIQVFSTLLCQVFFHWSSIFLLHLLRLYHSELIILWAWAVHSQTMKTALKSWLYFWIAKITSSFYWLCVLLSESICSERHQECIY